MKKINPFLLLLIIFIPIILIYFQSLNYYFFQDDWFILNRLNHEGLLTFYVPRTDVIYYRPLGMQTFFYITNSLFGLNPIPYHLITFSFHLINTGLIFYIIFKLFRSKLSASMGAFIYGTAAFHFMTLSWLSLSWNVFGAFFIISSTISYYNSFGSRKCFYQTAAFIFFILALLCTEFAVMVPLFLVAFAFFFLKKNLNEIVKTSRLLISLMVLAVLSYLILRFVLFPLPANGDYQLELSLKTFKNLVWYILWLFNLSEEFKYQFIFSKLSLTQTIIKDGTSFLVPTVVSFLLTISSFCFLIFKSKINKATLFASVVIFIIFLAPVLFLSTHTYPYYLTLPSLGLVLIISKIVPNVLNNKVGLLLLSIFAYSWFFSAFLSVSFNRQTHWVHKEQSLAEEAIKKISKVIYSTPQPDSIITISTGNTMFKPALFDQEALQVLFNNSSIRTIYHSDPTLPPQKTDYLIEF